MASLTFRRKQIISGTSGLLLLDIDRGVPVPKVGRLCLLLRRAGYRPVWLMQKRSRSGKGWHLVLKVTPRPKSATEVVALQAILGSDVMREACNLRRAVLLPMMPRWARKMWNVLYE
jgi:hypothetical protein